MKRIYLTLLTLVLTLSLQAQMLNPVNFKSEMKMLQDNEAEILFSASISPGWHVYSTELGNEGPIEATFNVNKMEGAERVGRLTTRGKEIKKYDEMFGMELRFFENSVAFVQKIKFTKSQYVIDCYLEYGACNDENCLPPTEVAFRQNGEVKLTPKQPEEKRQEQEEPVQEVVIADTAQTDTAVVAVPTIDTLENTDLWQPVIEELRTLGASDSIAGQSLLYILLMGFIGGLLAVCMPCIWPIIPMTVSFFLKRAKADKKKGIRDAFTYGISIIVIYLGLGLCVTAIFGSDTLNEMSTNAVFNVFLFLLLVVFALSFFGWFEIKLPESWANSIDTKASATSGLISIFLMAFTLVLVSFSCTAPIIGLLLVETTTSGNWLAPAFGMFGFAIALALPFTLFALFPSWLKQAPKSGSWMNSIKVVLGFVELAFALKFFSVADLTYHWHLLDREVFLSLWIVIFALLGAYLCGWLKFQSDTEGSSDQRPMPVICIMGGLVSLAFAVYMVPGLWGAPCKAISAFAPPINTQDFNLNTKVVEARFTDYEQGMAAAKAEGKPVLLDFTGFGCVNCRKMESDVWTDPQVADLLTKKYVLISLFVDDRTPLPTPMEVVVDGVKQPLETIGKKWSYLQSHKFGANAQPFYVILDNQGKPLAESRAYVKRVDDFLKFLNTGLRNYD
jgi:thiol:disulfide interchange protein DsbD